jgi:CheY-like chemotaxis protein
VSLPDRPKGEHRSAKHEGTPSSAGPHILVASGVVADAELVGKLLRDEFEHVTASTDLDRSVEDFEATRPDVLVLAFNGLQAAEQYYLGLYRRSTQIHALPHRTVILCNKDDLRRVYELCKKAHFDDYVLFWPMGHDAPRLPMAVHHALRQLSASAAGTPTASEFAAQARPLAALESLLDQHAARGSAQLDAAGLSLQRAQQGVGPAQVEAVAAAMRPLREWNGALQRDLAPQLDSARALQAMADRVRPLVLLVDDDEFQHKLLRKLLQDEPVELSCALSATEALAGLGRRRPELILMDVDLPGLDGVEATRRIKAEASYASIPVLMVTGHGDKEVVVRSMKAGAVGFVVKPFNRETLIAKVRACLHGAEAVSP